MSLEKSLDKKIQNKTEKNQQNSKTIGKTKLDFKSTKTNLIFTKCYFIINHVNFQVIAFVEFLCQNHF